MSEIKEADAVFESAKGVLGFFVASPRATLGWLKKMGAAPLGLAEIIGCDVGNDKHFNAAAIFTMARRGDR
jgi:hypothetical protein